MRRCSIKKNANQSFHPIATPPDDQVGAQAAQSDANHSCAKLVHLSGGVKVPVAMSEAPHGIPSIGLSVEQPKASEQRRLSVCREYCRPQGHSPKAIRYFPLRRARMPACLLHWMWRSMADMRMWRTLPMACKSLENSRLMFPRLGIESQ
jgi:hypothetical protein